MRLHAEGRRSQGRLLHCFLFERVFEFAVCKTIRASVATCFEEYCHGGTEEDMGFISLRQTGREIARRGAEIAKNTNSFFLLEYILEFAVGKLFRVSVAT